MKKTKESKSALNTRLRPLEDYFGELFKRLREDENLSLDELSELTKVNKQYLLYLENEQFDKLPASVYVRGFIKRSLKIFSNCDEQAKTKLWSLYFEKVSRIPTDLASPINSKGIGGRQHKKHIFGPGQFALLAVIIFLGVIFSFLVIRFTPFLFEPKIEITTPSSENTVVNMPSISFEGSAKFTSLLTLDGNELYIGENGKFSTEVALEEGLNRIVLEGENVFGRRVEVVKKVVYIKN